MAIKVQGTTVIDDSRNLQNTVNVNATGNAYANTFIGDGSQLTNLPAGGSSTELVASGTLSDGSAVVVNADGTVSVAAQTTTIAFVDQGTSTAFAGSTITQDITAAYDTNSNKLVIAYRNSSNSNYATAIVGTVSGNSISFGSAVVFNSNSTDPMHGMVFDSYNNKIVIAFAHYSSTNYGKAIVGTVSGTSISFGSAANFSTGSMDHQSIAFDSNSNKVVIAYQDGGNSSQGTAVVGTVSGTSISFGSEVIFNAASTSWTSTVFDSSNNKIIISYRDAASEDGRSIVGTVSGTSISFGTAVTFADHITYVASAFDSNANKVVVAYDDDDNSSKGTARVGTVSGTSISFGTAVVYNTSSVSGPSSMTFDSTNNRILLVDHDFSVGTAHVGTVSGTSISFGAGVEYGDPGPGNFYPIAVYDPDNDVVVIAYSTSVGGSRGYAVVGSTGSISTNLTSENFIGISDGAYANGATATIQLVGATDDAQSGLTTGSLHYVLANGSISTTAGSPSVVAGLALSSTELAIKAQ